MYTLEEFKSATNKVISNSNLTGVVAEALGNVISNALYLNEINSINTVLESSFTRSTLLNSRIQHASDLMYSVPRGRNQVIDIVNAVATTNISVKKYDLLAFTNGLYLYYNEDFKATQGEQIPSLKLLVSDSEVTEIKLNVSNKMYFDIDGPISNDIFMYRITADGLSDAYYTINTDMYDQLRNSSLSENGTSVLDITLPGFGSRIYANPNESSKGGFSSGYTHVCRYFKLSENKLELTPLANNTSYATTTLSTLPNYSFGTDSTKISVPLIRLSTSFNIEPRLLDLHSIYYNAVQSIKNNKMVLALNDVTDIFNAYFGAQVASSYAKITDYNVTQTYVKYEDLKHTYGTLYYKRKEGGYVSVAPQPSIYEEQDEDLVKIAFDTIRYTFEQVEITNPDDVATGAYYAIKVEGEQTKGFDLYEFIDSYIEGVQIYRARGELNPETGEYIPEMINIYTVDNKYTPANITIYYVTENDMDLPGGGSKEVKFIEELNKAYYVDANIKIQRAEKVTQNASESIYSNFYSRKVFTIYQNAQFDVKLVSDLLDSYKYTIGTNEYANLNSITKSDVYHISVYSYDGITFYLNKDSSGKLTDQIYIMKSPTDIYEINQSTKTLSGNLNKVTMLYSPSGSEVSTENKNYYENTIKDGLQGLFDPHSIAEGEIITQIKTKAVTKVDTETSNSTSTGEDASTTTTGTVGTVTDTGSLIDSTVSISMNGVTFQVYVYMSTIQVPIYEYKCTHTKVTDAPERLSGSKINIYKLMGEIKDLSNCISAVAVDDPSDICIPEGCQIGFDYEVAYEFI
jgi:hypothetical protein